MTTIDLYNQAGEKKASIKVNDEIFAIKDCNHTLIHEALIRQNANGRVNLAHTKLRGEVRGGGAKSRPQKGSGRSRQGGIRNIHMKGGGVAFGPRNNRNFAKLMPKKQRRKALFSALTLKCNDGEIAALENYETDKIKTKIFAEMLKKLPFNRTLLLVVPENNNVLQLSSRNLENVKIVLAENLNIKDIVSFKNILFLKEALDKIESVFLKAKN